jgi:hypothetical protein
MIGRKQTKGPPPPEDTTDTLAEIEAMRARLALLERQASGERAPDMGEWEDAQAQAQMRRFLEGRARDEIAADSRKRALAATAKDRDRIESDRAAVKDERRALADATRAADAELGGKERELDLKLRDLAEKLDARVAAEVAATPIEVTLPRSLSRGVDHSDLVRQSQRPSARRPRAAA